MAALTGLQIQKLLPKTNCKECGCSTCLAFAMKLAAKKAELKECPYASEEAKAVLGAAAEPPVRTVVVGQGGGAFRAGGETVLHRHEKTFVNRTGIGVLLPDDLEPGRLEAEVRRIREWRIDRAGETSRVDAVGIECRSGRIDDFAAALTRTAALWDRAIVARSDDPRALLAAAGRLRGKRPLLASAAGASAAELIDIAASSGSVLALAAGDIDGLIEEVRAAEARKFRDLFLELRTANLAERLLGNTVLRRAAIKGSVRSAGYPMLRVIEAQDPADAAIEGGLEVVKYGGLVLLPSFDPALLVPLLTLRQSIYTDPQKPIQVEPKVYAIGDPGPRSPVFATTNFSLTYFIVSGELENSGTSAWLLVVESEGMSVLTAWAAGKFGGAKIAAALKESGLAEKLEARKIIIPGYVSTISGELEEILPGWQVVVGPQEAADLEGFVKNVLSA